SSTNWGAGGGGSSYTNINLVTNVTHSQGYQSGHGYISLNWDEITCESPRTPYAVSITPIPTPTTTIDSVYCGNSGTLLAEGSTHAFRWYTQPIGGNPFSTDSNVQVLN